MWLRNDCGSRLSSVWFLPWSLLGSSSCEFTRKAAKKKGRLTTANAHRHLSKPVTAGIIDESSCPMPTPRDVEIPPTEDTWVRREGG